MDFDQNEITTMEGANEDREVRHDTNSGELPESIPPTTSGEVKIEDLIRRGKKGVTNFQMIPAIQKAVKENSVEQLILLRAHYPQAFENSMRYLKKKQREFVAASLK